MNYVINSSHDGEEIRIGAAAPRAAATTVGLQVQLCTPEALIQGQKN